MINKLNKKEIIELLPHREPMLLIEELYDIKKLFSATAIVNVKKDSFFVKFIDNFLSVCLKNINFFSKFY